MNRHRCFATFIVCALFLDVGSELAEAQIPPAAQLKSKLQLRYRRARSGSPIPVIWKFDWPDRPVTRGTLEYEAYDESTLLAEVRIPDFVLSPGKNEFNLLFPAFFVGSSATSLTIRSRFVTSNQSFEFAEQMLRVPTQYLQWFSLGVVAGAQARATAAEMRFFDKIRLETFLPPEAAVNQSATVSFDVKTSELPSDPLTLCNFDVLAITPTALAELRADHSDALRKWVAAGGSLCVIVGGGLEPRHADLLNDLTSELPARPKFVVGPKGFLLPDEDPPGKVLTVPKGLGRVAVLRPKLFETLDPDATTWIETARFLLKGRKNAQLGWDEESEFVQVNGRAAQGAQPRTPARGPWGRNSPFENLNAAPLGHLDELFALLMPIGVSTVPIGVDRFDLGCLRGDDRPDRLLRAGCPAAAAIYLRAVSDRDDRIRGVHPLALSSCYLGSTDSRRAIEIYDVVPGGAVARRSRIEMLFLSQENTVPTPVESGLFSVVGRGNMMSRVPLPQVNSNDTPQTVGVNDRFPDQLPDRPNRFPNGDPCSIDSSGSIPNLPSFINRRVCLARRGLIGMSLAGTY